MATSVHDAGKLAQEQRSEQSDLQRIGLRVRDADHEIALLHGGEQEGSRRQLAQRAEQQASRIATADAGTGAAVAGR
jgi:hypothetical protein